MPKILIGADICPIESNTPFFIAGNPAHIFNDLLPIIESADLVVGNLEGPFIERPSPIRKTGPTFGFPVSCLNGIKAAGIDVLCLANNHILDHGESGLRFTINACNEAGISTFGAGQNLEAASELFIRDLNGVKVAFLAVAEHEFSIAGNSRWGANPIDIIRFVRTIANKRLSYDYLIVLYHGADEFHVPTPRVQEQCRFMIEQGATAVIVQHPHTLGGVEHYHGGYAVYGQGAFVMDEALYRDLPSFHRGFLVELEIRPGSGVGISLVPYRQLAPKHGVTRLSPEEERAFHRTMDARSLAVSNPETVRKEWSEFCKRNEIGAFGSLLGHGGLLRRTGMSRWLVERLRRSRRMLAVRNMVLCETHRETLQTLFEQDNL